MRKGRGSSGVVVGPGAQAPLAEGVGSRESLPAAERAARTSGEEAQRPPPGPAPAAPAPPAPPPRLAPREAVGGGQGATVSDARSPGGDESPKGESPPLTAEACHPRPGCNNGAPPQPHHRLALAVSLFTGTERSRRPGQSGCCGVAEHAELEPAPGLGPSEGDICAAQAWDSIKGTAGGPLPTVGTWGPGSQATQLCVGMGPKAEARGRGHPSPSYFK